MSIAEKLTTVAENVPKVYEAGQQAEYDRFWDSFQQNGKRNNYYCAFGGMCWKPETLKPKYKVAPVEDASGDQYAVYMFFHCNRMSGSEIDFRDIADKFDFSNIINASQMFTDSNINYITADFSKATTLNTAFAENWGAKRTHLTLTVSEKCTNYTNTFNNATKLSNLFFTEGSVIARSISLSSSPLTVESMKSVINALKDYSGTGKTYTLTFKANRETMLTDEEKAVATNKGWTLVWG